MFGNDEEVQRICNKAIMINVVSFVMLLSVFIMNVT